MINRPQSVSPFNISRQMSMPIYPQNHPSPSQQIIPNPTEIAQKLEGKLALVINMDNTILDYISVLSSEIADKFIESDKVHKDLFHLFTVEDKLYLVRFRDHALEFLDNLSEKYKYFIFSQSIPALNQPIATEISRHTKGGPDFSSDSSSNCSQINLLPQRLTIILDHPLEKNNSSTSTFNFSGRLPIFPFHFFAKFNSNYQFHHQYRPDDALLGISHALLRLHEIYHVACLSHIALALSAVKRQVFVDCHIVFGPDLELEESPDELVSATDEFGGTPHYQFIPYATHIVTDKVTEIVKEAEKINGIWVVSSSWWRESVLRCEKQDERFFPVPGCQSPTDGKLPKENPPQEDDLRSSDLESTVSNDEEESSSSAEEDDESIFDIDD